MLVGAYADRRAVLSGAWHGRILLLGGAALCLVGLAIGAAALSRAAGLLLARFGPGLAGQLAGRRLVVDPGASARAVTGTALVVVLLGWAVTLLPGLTESDITELNELIPALRPKTVMVTLKADADVNTAVNTLRAVTGVSQVAPIRHARMLRDATEPVGRTTAAPSAAQRLPEPTRPRRGSENQSTGC